MSYRVEIRAYGVDRRLIIKYTSFSLEQTNRYINTEKNNRKVTAIFVGRNLVFKRR